MALPLWILALGSMAVGVYFTFTHPEPGFTAPGWLMPVAIGTAVAGILLAWATYQRQIINPASLAAAFGPIRYAAIHRFWIDDIWMIGALQAEAWRRTRGARFLDRAALMANAYLARLQQPSGLFHHGPQAPFA